MQTSTRAYVLKNYLPNKRSELYMRGIKEKPIVCEIIVQHCKNEYKKNPEKENRSKKSRNLSIP